MTSFGSNFHFILFLKTLNCISYPEDFYGNTIMQSSVVDLLVSIYQMNSLGILKRITKTMVVEKKLQKILLEKCIREPSLKCNLDNHYIPFEDIVIDCQ